MERSFYRIMFVPLAIAIGIFLVIHFNIHTMIVDRDRLSAFIESYGPLSVFIFILIQMLQVIVSPLPGDVTGLIGGYLYGSIMGTVFSTIGLTLGSWIAFGLARYFGLPLVERLIKPSTIRKYDNFLKHQGLFISFLFFLIPGFPKDTLCYILGLSHMRLREFLVISTAGRLLGTILLSIQGSSLRKDEDLIFFIVLGVTIVIILAGYFHVGWSLRSILKGKKTPPSAPDPPQDIDPTSSAPEGKPEGQGR